jgi:hypothetical protein
MSHPSFFGVHAEPGNLGFSTVSNTLTNPDQMQPNNTISMFNASMVREYNIPILTQNPSDVTNDTLLISNNNILKFDTSTTPPRFVPDVVNAEKIQGLDVCITGIVNDQVLKWDSANNCFENATLGGGSGTVTEVDVSGGTTGLTTSGGPITTSGTITLNGTLAVDHGGTGLTSYTAGDIIQATGATTLAAITKGGNNTVLQVDSTGTLQYGTVTNAMLAGSIDLTSKVTGTLPVGNGGTGQTSATNGGYLKGNGTSFDVYTVSQTTTTTSPYFAVYWNNSTNQFYYYSSK